MPIVAGLREAETLMQASSPKQEVNGDVFREIEMYGETFDDQDPRWNHLAPRSRDLVREALDKTAKEGDLTLNEVVNTAIRASVSQAIDTTRKVPVRKNHLAWHLAGRARILYQQDNNQAGNEVLELARNVSKRG
jgi:hypothetical protein